MKIWIIGSGGLLGSTMSRICQKRNLAFLSTTREEIDITSLELLQRFAEKIQPTHIINCAAYTDVDAAEREPKEAFAVNATGAENIAQTARESGAKFLHISTDYVFSGSERTTPFSELDICQPIGVYGASKREGELRVLQEFPQACILRTSWLFGSKGKNFISGLLQLLQSREMIQATSDQLGRATYAQDLAEAALALICHSGVFHFANQGEVSRYKIAEAMKAAALERGVKIACKEILPVRASDFPTVAPRPRYSVLCTKKVEGILGWKPRGWKEVVSEYVAHANI
jgi:dTDP-4-dehydrorhamnose reductase